MHHPILISRHGQSTFNRDKRIIGQKNPVLTQAGRRAGYAMAKKLTVEFNGITNGIIYSSPLVRAENTAAIFSEYVKWPVRIRKALAELSSGSWEGLNRDALGLGECDIRQGWTDRPPKGESYADGEKRVTPVVSEIIDHSLTGPVLVVGHAALNRILLCLLIGLAFREVVHMDMPHGTIYRVQPDQGDFRRETMYPLLNGK